ncbi:MAG: hypothetical protein QF796_03715 [Acidimicrobiales bacterium]|nr:hypothetical protein [Acidimicrobiales bacterium]MDP6649226.1 hypothetical protein [Acidimicrobiales bacterium]
MPGRRCGATGRRPAGHGPDPGHAAGCLDDHRATGLHGRRLHRRFGVGLVRGRVLMVERGRRFLVSDRHGCGDRVWGFIIERRLLLGLVPGRVLLVVLAGRVLRLYDG